MLGSINKEVQKVIKEMAGKITDDLIQKKVIDEEVRDIYIYGSELLVSEILSTMLILVIGAFAGCICETILYLCIYTSIRVYAGGYHAATHRNCIIMFNFFYIEIIYIIKMLENANMETVLLYGALASGVFIFVLAPVEDLRKPLEIEERVVYKKKARTRSILYITTLVAIYNMIPALRDEIAYGMAAVCEVALLVLCGFIKNRLMVSKRKYDIRGKEYDFSSNL